MNTTLDPPEWSAKENPVGDAKSLLRELSECANDKEKIAKAAEWLGAAYVDGIDDGWENTQALKDDLSEDFGWLRTRITRGEKHEALSLVDGIQGAI